MAENRLPKNKNAPGGAFFQLRAWAADQAASA